MSQGPELTIVGIECVNVPSRELFPGHSCSADPGPGRMKVEDGWKWNADDARAQSVARPNLTRRESSELLSYTR